MVNLWLYIGKKFACTPRFAKHLAKTLCRDALPAMAMALLAVPAFGQSAPASGPVRVIGTYGAGCIAGAVALPSQGPGFQVIRQSRTVVWGHPQTIAAIEELGARVRAAGLPDIYVSDIAAPRGGPLSVHAGHQLGLEADIWLDASPKPTLSPAAREAMEVPSVVRPDGRDVDPARWNPDLVRLLRLAAGLPDVDRIFVNPAIKRKLCEEAGADRAWLHLIRPWYDHAAHFHIRFRCPAGQPECVTGAPVPPGDGCDATLQWWFDQLDQKPAPPPPPRPRPQPPEACRAILAAPGKPPG
jgi:penicillin-insensitive murein endopeptidase